MVRQIGSLLLYYHNDIRQAKAILIILLKTCTKVNGDPYFQVQTCVSLGLKCINRGVVQTYVSQIM